MKLTFTMADPDPKKHSTRFDFEKFEGGATEGIDPSKFKPSFYIPRPVAQNAKRIRVTIEEL